MIGISVAYDLAGLMFAAIAWRSARDAGNPRRLGASLFWALLALSFLAGDYLGDLGNGTLVLALAILGGFGLMGRGTEAEAPRAEREAQARHWGYWLFPVLFLPPVIALAGTIWGPALTWNGRPLVDPKQGTLIWLALGIVAALAATVLYTRQRLGTPLRDARRLVELVGWAAILPQVLAALGGIFALAKVGDAVAALVGQYLTLDHRFPLVCAYTGGMALLTILMGNAFAAFPVMTSGIALPLLVGRFGGDPAVISAIGMLSGFCGTLMTPMAANFNIVPAALLELPDRNAVIRAQVPTALLVLVANTLLIQILGFPK
ncbi:DUF979 domain-containing protein [Nitrospirillum amazonense]|uniref:Putative membrane protein n=1 Tax=Nitrospirillum amazonense TaxID=28077 RepID=A0A560JC49_9PROT|nr:DUF979 domain-containing protein [Nitrospirillum amazonense]MDG3439963.1 DUF979 domain-containing protein [Nitrospirillum amazonense]TWB68778.1 putative membrane protein [Nitrospirillum amazonense]